jgi:hypothetical protein
MEIKNKIWTKPKFLEWNFLNIKRNGKKANTWSSPPPLKAKALFCTTRPILYSPKDWKCELRQKWILERDLFYL